MPDFLDIMENSSVADAARSAPQPVPKAADWFSFRRRHPDLGIGKAGEDGSLEDWQQLLREVGADKLTSAVIKARSTGRKGDRIWFSRVLEAIPVDSSQSKDKDGKSDAELSKAAKRARMDLLIWAVIHNPDCYADARCTWREGEGEYQRTVSCGGWTAKVKVKERICVQGTTVWEKMRDRAAVAQAFIFAELKKDITPQTKPGVHKIVSESPQWRAYLSAHQLIA